MYLEFNNDYHVYFLQYCSRVYRFKKCLVVNVIVIPLSLTELSFITMIISSRPSGQLPLKQII